MKLADAERIFNEALQIASPEERAGFVKGACGNDAGLRDKVDRLLQAHESSPDFLATEPGDRVSFEPISEGPGTVIGRYKLLQKIGEGGMGVVYMAEQQEPVTRKVALKIIKLGMDTKQVIARFEAERQALALMDHPNIARVLDGGATESGRPYFVMELVQGVPITEFCDRNHLTARERIDLFIPVCQAIQSAHQKGIIHRDIKPSNILVTLHHSEPMPKVIDFGVAKAINQRLTEKTLFTHYATLIGTPAYMSPEQAEMTSLDVDTRTDLYALGVLLYELLTGTTPFPDQRLRSLGYGEMQRIIAEEEPEKPSTRLSTMANEQKTVVARNRGLDASSLDKLCRSDLDWIVLKCLEKDRRRRYDTPNELVADLKRHLDDEPVFAAAPSLLYQLQKFCRRNRPAVTAAAAVLVALLAGLCIATWQAVRARNAEQAARQAQQAAQEQSAQARQDRDRAVRAESEARDKAQIADTQRQQAETEKKNAQRHLHVANMNLAQQAWEQNNVGHLSHLLEETASFRERGFEWYYWQRQCHLELKTLRGHLHWVRAVAFSPDGQRIASGAGDQTVKVWEAATGKELLTLKGHSFVVYSVAFSPDGRRIVSGSHDRTARIWEVSTGKELLSLKGHQHGIKSVAFSPDGQRIVTAGGFDGMVKVWDAANGKELLTLKAHSPLAESVAFSPDGTRIVTGGTSPAAKVWETATGKELLKLKDHSMAVVSVAFSPDGQRIVTGSQDQTAKVWDAANGKEVLTLKPIFDSGKSWTPDIERLAKT